MIIRERIWHGDYRNVRDVAITQRNSLTFADIEVLLADSPYNGGKSFAELAANPYIAKLFVDLSTKGKGSFGWADYQIVYPK